MFWWFLGARRPLRVVDGRPARGELARGRRGPAYRVGSRRGDAGVCLTAGAARESTTPTRRALPKCPAATTGSDQLAPPDPAAERLG